MDLLIIPPVAFGLYLFFAKVFKVEHSILRALLPYWLLLQIKNFRSLDKRELLTINGMIALFWLAPAILVFIMKIMGAENVVTNNHERTVAGLLIFKSLLTTQVVFLSQIIATNIFGMAFCFVNSGLADYTQEIHDAVYSIPVVKSQVSSNDPHHKAYLTVEKKSATDYEIKTNALISQTEFLTRREEIENRVARGFYLLRTWRRDAGIYRFRIGKLKTVRGADGMLISNVQQDDLEPYKGKGLDQYMMINLGHDGVETVRHDIGVHKFNIVGGIQGSGKTMYAKNMCKERLRVNGASTFVVWVDIMKGGHDTKLATKNYYDIVGNDKIVNGELMLSENEIYRRREAASKNRNFYLIDTEEEFVALGRWLDRELESRKKFIDRHPSCTSWDEINKMMLRRDKNFVPYPVVSIWIDEWSDMADKFWEHKRNQEVSETMEKIIAYVSVARDRGLEITFMTQRFTITGQFGSARNQCFFHLGYGVTESEFDYAINIKASKPPMIRGSMSIVSQTESNRGLGIVCAPKLTNLGFGKAVTDANETFHEDYLEWLLKSRASLMSTCDEQMLREANRNQFELLSA